MKFEWDENKRRTNATKHGLTFETAREAFADPYAIFELDQYVDGEERWNITALIGVFSVAIVAHTYRDSENGTEIIRIISARYATREERQRYDRARLG